MTFVMQYDKRNRDNIAKLGDNTKAAALKLYAYLVKEQIDVLIYETIRSLATQKANVAKGASQTLQSYHIVGQALDFVMVDSKGAAKWDGYYSADAKKLVAEAKRLGFEWGGDWKSFHDAPHLQFNYKGYGTDTFGKAVAPVKPKPAAKPVAKPAPAKPAAALKATGKGVVTGDVFTHSKADLKAATRSKVLKKGETISIYGEVNGLYRIGTSLFVSKKYVVPMVAPKAKTGTAKGDVWLHSKADVTAKSRYKVLVKGKKVGVYGEMNGMYKVRFDGKTMYVSKGYLTVK